MSEPVGYVWAWSWSTGPRLASIRVYPTVGEAREWWATAWETDPIGTRGLELLALSHVPTDPTGGDS